MEASRPDHEPTLPRLTDEEAAFVHGYPDNLPEEPETVVYGGGHVQREGHGWLLTAPVEGDFARLALVGGALVARYDRSGNLTIAAEIARQTIYICRLAELHSADVMNAET